MTECPACHWRIVEPIYSPGPQPLMALNLPKTDEEANTATSYPMNFYMCCFCGHVFNADFDYAKVPYKEDSNLMYNQGTGWQKHLQNIADLLRNDYHVLGKTIIDIGAGDGGFLDIINKDSLDEGVATRCIAFEPGIESETCNELGLETYADYFIPQRDLTRYRPDFLVCRHVLEHLQNPRDFVAEISYYANKYHMFPYFLAEVPCISKAIDTYRITDFLYEHVSNFTQRSLRVMFESAGWVMHDEFLTYDNEVAIWIGRPKGINTYSETRAKIFRSRVMDSIETIRSQLEVRRRDGLKIAFWGGTGKGAAFLNTYKLYYGRVVDSDLAKVGRYVPGMGQQIEFSDQLLEEPVDTIVITTRWRAADIYIEIKRKGIQYKELLVVDNLHLVPYNGE